MRKEVLWAAIIGISFGLIIAFGVYRINSTIKPEISNPENTPSPQKNNSEFKITLDKPENDDVVTQDTISVSGITKPLSWITVSGEDSDYILQSDDQGIFLQDVDLISGVNQIKVTAFDPEGNQSIEKVLVVYSSSFQTTPVASPSANPTSSSDSAIRQKVQEKVANALNKPKAFIGVVTDIADSTIQIKTTGSEIKQISTDPQATTVVKVTTTSKTVKLTDIAIGDFIVGMGYVNTNSVLKAQRILITDPITEPKINAVFGKITDTSKKTLTVSSLKGGQGVDITPGTKTDIELYTKGAETRAKFASIGDGDLVIYVSDTSGDTPVIRAVFVVQKASS